MKKSFRSANGVHQASDDFRVEPILIVENNIRDSYFASVALESAGFKTIAASDGEQALKLAREQSPLLVILDVMLPARDGWEFCRELRRASDVPIIILTTRGAASERILGLTLGADDYIIKPCSAGELVARVRAILRRARPLMRKVNALLAHQGLVMDAEKRRVTLHGHAVSLTCFEYKLLHALMTGAGRIFLREELLNHLYANDESVVDRVIDVHVGNLRRKIEDDPSHPRHILTARGLGYQFADNDESFNQMDAPLAALNDYRQLFENAITGMYHTTVGGRYLRANPMLAEMFGYESSVKMVEGTIDLNEGFYVERGRRAEFTDLIREQQIVRGFESAVYRSDGSQMWISEHALAIKDASGKLIGFQGTTLDVTERKREEMTLHNLDSTLNSSSGSIH